MPDAIYHETLTQYRIAVLNNLPEAKELEQLVISLDPLPTAPDVRAMAAAEFRVAARNYARDLHQWQARSDDRRQVTAIKSSSTRSKA